MNNFLLMSAGVIAFAAGASFLCYAARLASAPKPPTVPPWSIVCSDDGKWSFYDGNGELYWGDFYSQKQAEQAMEAKMTEPKPDIDGIDAQVAARKAKFKLCEK